MVNNRTFEALEMERNVTVPAWNDPELKVGTMVRGALWLVQEVGENGTFTKDMLRAAFPGVSQADRRLRDLRAYGWVILTSTEDATLTAEDQRFVTVGVPVWDAAERRAAAPKIASSKEIQAALARDDFMCTLCGITGGEQYIDDSNQTAVLSVTRRDTLLPGDRRRTSLVTECKRCRAGSSNEAADVAGLLASIEALGTSDRERLARWIQRGRRDSTPLERVWSTYRRLPGDARDDIRATWKG